jgi:hypothetical protein
LKIRGNLRKLGCITGINDTGGKFATGATTPAANFSTAGTACVVDTVAKYHQYQRHWMALNLPLER